MKLLQGVPSLIFGVLFDLVVVNLPLLLPQEKSHVKIIGLICAKMPPTSWTIKKASEEQQEMTK